MLNSFIQYFYFCAESIDFYSNADLTAPIDFFDCVDQYSMFHVQYIKQDSSGHFSF
jgi:hypothetical protein